MAGPRRLAVASVCALLAASLVLGLARAAKPGELDRSFGDRGKVVSRFCGHAVGFPLAIGSQGRIVAAGTNNHYDDFCLIRFRPNGDLDRSFGDGGTVVANFGTHEEGAHSAAIDSRGRIVAAGRSRREFAVARFNPDGSADTSFGGDGEVTTAIGERASAYSVAVDSQDRIVAAGTGFSRFALARYKKDGTLDPSFGTGGVVTTNFETDRGLAIDSKDRIVAAGGEDGSFALARFNPDGSLDPSFGGDGKVTTEFHGSASSVVIRPHERIVAAGSAHGGRRHPFKFALARYRPNGKLDRSFSRNGKVQTAIGESAGASTVLFDSHDRIVAAGSSDRDFALARYYRNGRLDRSFSGNGKVRPGFGPGASSAAIDPHDRIVLQGIHSKIVLARFIGYRRR